jgi:hypothetical protein
VGKFSTFDPKIHFIGHYVIVPNITFPNVTIPKFVKIPNINRNPTILPLYMPDP